MDQIGNSILPNNRTMYHDCGADQVDIVAKEEKHACTVLVASTPDGDFLLLLPVCAGATCQSTPSAWAPRMNEVLEYGFDFAFVKSPKASHFSTVKTMKEVCVHCLVFYWFRPKTWWIENIVVPYWKGVIESDPELDEDQQMLIYIVCYPVHVGEEFQFYIWDRYPFIIISFVPANCAVPTYSYCSM